MQTDILPWRCTSALFVQLELLKRDWIVDLQESWSFWRIAVCIGLDMLVVFWYPTVVSRPVSRQSSKEHLPRSTLCKGCSVKMYGFNRTDQSKWVPRGVTGYPCWWGLEYNNCIFCRRVRPPPRKWCSKYDTKLHLMVRLQF